MPHCAIAHDGSVFNAALNASTARENSNECSSATARSNVGWAAALHEVWKFTAEPLLRSCTVCVVLRRKWSCRQCENDRPAHDTLPRPATRYCSVFRTMRPLIIVSADSVAGKRARGDLRPVSDLRPRY
jgi:hypothetical protein